MSVDQDDVKMAGVLFEDDLDASLWDAAHKLLIVAKLLESAQNEVDETIISEIRNTADKMAIEVLLKYRGLNVN